MSVRFVVAAVVGVVVGYFSGSYQAGFTAFSLAYGVTGSLDPNAKQTGPRLDDLKGPQATEGAAIPYIEGVWRTAGSYVWNSDKQEVSTTTTTDGKGGPGVDSTTFTYVIDVLIMFSINELTAIRRVWSNGKLVWSAVTTDAASAEASETTDSWAELRFYSGAPDQLPDPDYEAAVGIGNAPAYRGRAAAFIKGLNLGSSGQLPVLTFEVCSNSTNTVQYLAENTYTTTGGKGLITGVAPYVAQVGHILRIPDFTSSYESRAVSLQTWKGKQFDLAVEMTALQDLGDQTNFVAGIADDATYWLATGKGASIFVDTDDIVQDSTGVGGVGTEYGGVLAYVRCDHRTLLFMQASGAHAKGIMFIGDPTRLVTTYDPKTATKYGDAWLVLGSDGVTHVYDETLTLLGTFTAPPTLPSNTVYLTDVVTGELYCHAAADIYRWDGTSAWQSITTGLPSSLQANGFPITGETMYNGSLSVLKCSLDGSTDPQTFTLTTLRRAVTVALNEVPLDELVQRLCLRTGLLTADDIDVTDLADDSVRGIALSSGTTREAIETLMPAKFFDAYEGEKIEFVKRGGAPVATIPYAAMGVSSGDPVEPLPTTRADDIVLPAMVFIKFANALNDYQDGSTAGDRLTTLSTSTTTLELPMVLTPTEAKRIANVQTMDLQTSLVALGPVSITRAYAALKPTDPIILVGKDGSRYRARITKITDAAGIRTLELVQDDAGAVVSVASADQTDYSTVLVRLLGDTTELLLDVPMLRDADNDSGFYAQAKPLSVADKWSGAVFYSSPDDVTLTSEVTFTDRAIFGICKTILGDWHRPRVFDEINRVTVDTGGALLSSSTRDALLNDQTINAFAIGVDGRWEIGQFRTATMISAGVYTLSGLLRGSRGTEWASTGHVANESFALLQTAGMRRIKVDSASIGATRYYRAVSVGKGLASANSQTLIDRGVALKPLSPVDLRASRGSSGDVTLAWKRRTRFVTRFEGPAGINVPLGETAEAYQVDVYADNTFAMIVRTLTASTPSVLYSHVTQISDFGSLPASLSCDVYQVSAEIGRGTRLRATVQTDTGGAVFLPILPTLRPIVQVASGTNWLVSREGTSSGGQALGLYVYTGSGTALTLIAVTGSSASQPYLTGMQLFACNPATDAFVLVLRAQGNPSLMRKMFHGTLPGNCAQVTPSFMPATEPCGLWWTGTEFRVLLTNGHVWSSADGGATWTDQGASTGVPAPTSSISQASIVVVGTKLAMKFEDAMYTCSALNGLAWTAAIGDIATPPLATYPASFFLTGIASNGARGVLIVIATKTGDPTTYGLVYTSTDGATWSKVVEQAFSGPPTYAHNPLLNTGAIVFDGTNFVCDLWAPTIGGSPADVLQVFNFGSGTVLTYADNEAQTGQGNASGVVGVGRTGASLPYFSPDLVTNNVLNWIEP